MEKTAESNVTAKIFIGCPLTAEIKMHLSKSSAWKQASIDKTGLTLVNFQEKEYLGFYLSEDKLTLDEFNHFEKEIKKHLQTYCPEISPDLFKVLTFPQLFIG